MDQMLDDATYGGCADYSLAFGALTRALGVPTVWVKTMDLDWIAEFQAHPDSVKTWRGHVFLEIYVDGAWVLLDPGALRVYEPYDPRSRLMPGSRFAYDKGGDPFDLVLSTRWDLWLKQTRRHFAPMSPSELRPLVFIAGDSPAYRWVAERCGAMGARVGPTFNCDFERFLAQARGQVLIVTCVGSRIVLPEAFHASHLPAPVAQLQELMAKQAHGVIERQLADGTRVVLVFGTTQAELRDAVATLRLD